jgi:hypothetical protein
VAPEGLHPPAPGGTDGTFRVAVPPQPGAVGYEIQRTGETADVLTVAVADLPVTLDGSGAGNLCVVVRAVGPGGRVSRDGGPFCSP